MGNFIGLVYATLKEEGIDTSKLSTNQAIEKFKELQEKKGNTSGSITEASEKERTQAENRKMNGESPKTETKGTPKQTEKQQPKYERNTSFENNMEIDWDLAEKNEKINGKNAKNPKRHDKYGNELISDEAFKVGQEAGQSYLDYEAKYGNDLSKLKRSNVFLDHLSGIIGNAITNNGFDPNQDITYTDQNQIIGSLIGEEVDLEKYSTRQSNGFTGRKYIDYQPK